MRGLNTNVLDYFTLTFKYSLDNTRGAFADLLQILTCTSKSGNCSLVAISHPVGRCSSTVILNVSVLTSVSHICFSISKISRNRKKTVDAYICSESGGFPKFQNKL